MKDLINREINEKEMRIYMLRLPDDTAKEYVPDKHDIRIYKKRLKQLIFIDEYIKTGGLVKQACQAAGVSVGAFYKWTANDTLFLEAFERSKAKTLPVLEEEMVRRGLHGYLEPVYYQGERVGEIRRYSDKLLKDRIARLDPRYKDVNQTNIGIQGEDIKISFTEPKKDKTPANNPEIEMLKDEVDQS